ncbi:MAG: leucine-rich repeat domain-containing protein [Candidatus Hodarchaeales archaeon]|jgi:Leucine-rich repeat (LRR) protein
MPLENQDNLNKKLQLFRNAIQLFSEDIPLEFITLSLGFSNVEELLEWLIKLDLESFEVTNDATKLVINSELKQELDTRLNSPENIQSITSLDENLEPIEIPDYHGTYLIKDDRNALEELEFILKHPIPKVIGKISMTKFGFIEKNYQIIGLLLSNKGLSQIPNQIIKFKNLKILDVSGNNLSEFPEVICKLKNLEALSMQFNHLYNVPEKIENLQSLKDLSLDCNHLKTLPDNIGSLKKLIRLTAGNNKITDIPDTIGNISTLQRLFLASNKLKIFSNGLFKLNNLIDLNLGDNEIIELPSQFSKLNNLRELYLMGNQIENISTLNGLIKLEALDLSGNYLTFIPKNIKELINLKYLNLKYNPSLENLAVEVGGTFGDLKKNMREIKEFIESI